MSCHTRPSGHQILVDGHVHYHRCFNASQFLDAAARNFRAVSSPVNSTENHIGYLLFADTPSSDSLSQLLKDPDDQLRAGWDFERLEEKCSVLAFRNRKPELVLVAGRQIVTQEGIEVLALACHGYVHENRPLHETLRAIMNVDAIPVIPWGFGKWKFRRGKLLEDFLRGISQRTCCMDQEVFLGDNGGRPSFMGYPRMFESAASAGIRILPGSDPLPFPSHVARPGSFGFVLAGDADLRRPVERLKSLLDASRTQPAAFGRLERVDRFMSNQLSMQFRKHVPRLFK